MATSSKVETKRDESVIGLKSPGGVSESATDPFGKRQCMCGLPARVEVPAGAPTETCRKGRSEVGRVIMFVTDPVTIDDINCESGLCGDEGRGTVQGSGVGAFGDTVNVDDGGDGDRQITK